MKLSSFSVSLILHIGLLYFLMITSTNSLSKLQKTIKEQQNLVKLLQESVEVTPINKLPNIAKKDIPKLLNKPQTEEVMYYKTQKEKILEEIKKELQKKQQQNNYIKQLKELRAIVKLAKNLKSDIKKISEISFNISNNNLDSINSPYISKIKEIIKSHWVLPKWLGDKNLKAIVSFQILEDGTITNIKFTQKSNNQDFDNLILNIFNEIKKFPPPPPDFKNIEIIVSFP